MTTLAFLSHLTAGRAQMGTSLAFHLVFALLGVGLPLLMLIAEGLYLRTGDEVWRTLARRWAKAFAILFAVGAVSGTVISFELGLLWPGFMAYAGGIIGMPFSLEGLAFFLEAIFVGIYLYGWDRLSPRMHWLSGVPVAIGGLASAFFIVTANAWMNAPSGFRVVHGRVVDVHPLQAMFNPAWATETAHMVIGAYLATGFAVASVYAVGMLRGRRDTYHRRGLILAMAVGAVFGSLQLGAGDLLGRTVAQNQPAKLAAIEGLHQTSQGAGLSLGIPLGAHGANLPDVRVPQLLSILAYDRTGATVRGLDSFRPADRPPLAVAVRLSFLGMVGIGTGLVALSLWFWTRRKRGRPWDDRWTLAAVAASGPLAVMANELGWTVTELGRQPWVIYGFLRTSQAITTAPGLGATFTGFTLLYVLLTVGTTWLLRRQATAGRRAGRLRTAIA